MNKHQIEHELSKRVSGLREFFKSKGCSHLCDDMFIGGGAIASMLNNEDVNDYDFYVNEVYLIRKILLFFGDRFAEISKKQPNLKIVSNGNGFAIKNEKGDSCLSLLSPKDTIDYINNVSISDDDTCLDNYTKDIPNYYPVFITENAITLKGGIQIITKFFGPPESVIDSFDFVHCKNYYSIHEGKLYLKPLAIESILCKELHYCGSVTPLSSVFRMRKFLKRGWNINAGNIFKIMFDISNKDFSNIDTLIENLVGVDIVYFSRAVNRIRDEFQNNDNFKITKKYIFSLMDEIFGE